MRKSWSKGYTKTTHPSVKKISDTMKQKGLDNFKAWREQMRALGKLKTTYPAFKRNGDLAELIGVVLGDGHIEVFPRCEALYILSNSNNPGFIKRYSNLVEKLFNKKPHVVKLNFSNCVRIRIYEKTISKRLGVPTGRRKNAHYKIPKWILRNRNCTIRYLRGLYEAEGSASVHLPTSTYKFVFSNLNRSLLRIVHTQMTRLHFHPHTDKVRVQISRKNEVKKAIELLQFRKY